MFTKAKNALEAVRLAFIGCARRDSLHYGVGVVQPTKRGQFPRKRESTSFYFNLLPGKELALLTE